MSIRVRLDIDTWTETLEPDENGELFVSAPDAQWHGYLPASLARPATNTVAPRTAQMPAGWELSAAGQVLEYGPNWRHADDDPDAVRHPAEAHQLHADTYVLAQPPPETVDPT